MRVVAELEFGSSPRVRGAGTIAFADAGALRIIPARAGSSDALNGRAWRDDSQVVELHVIKHARPRGSGTLTRVDIRW